MIIVYGAQWCSFCNRTKNFLDNNEFEYEFIDIDDKLEDAEHLIDMGFKTIPQVFVNDMHIGGFEEITNYFK